MYAPAVHRTVLLCAGALVLSIAAIAADAAGLRIYFIDVEGGQSTLIVTPRGQSFLVDTGYAGNGGRDAGRIADAARDAGVKRIDYLLITHFHGDHVGGAVELAARLPIRTFVDHDTPMKDDANAQRAYEPYAAARARGRHIVARPGDRLDLKGVDVTFVSSAAATISKPLDGRAEANPACPATAPDPAEPIENPRSTGFVLRFGRFRFVDLGDLSGAPLFSLFCPSNLIGRAALYLVPHHGGDDVVYPATFAVHPRVAIVNNGRIKGGSAEGLVALHNVAGLEDAWQLHRSDARGAGNFPDARIANLDETTGHWLKATAASDGSFEVTNGRTGETKKYPAERR